MKHEAMDAFMGDSRGGCHCTKGLVGLSNTMRDHRSVGRGNAIYRGFWSWTPFATHRRRAGAMGFIVSQQVLDLEIQVARRSKEEGKNW
jgi:hypothetical protein